MSTFTPLDRALLLDWTGRLRIVEAGYRETLATPRKSGWAGVGMVRAVAALRLIPAAACSNCGSGSHSNSLPSCEKLIGIGSRQSRVEQAGSQTHSGLIGGHA